MSECDHDQCDQGAELNTNPGSKIFISPVDLRDIGALEVFQIIINTVQKLKDKTAIILWSSFSLLILWGMNGNPKLLFPKAWRGALFPGIEWRDQLISYLGGFILVVVIPCCIIKFVFKEKLSKYGLGWSRDNLKPGLAALIVILAVSLPLFYLAASDGEIIKEYPLFGDSIKPGDWDSFLIYELVYFLFFINVEFLFRGYLLFGLYGFRDNDGVVNANGKPGPLVFGVYAVLIQMLVYTLWHIPKPSVEYIGAVFWGVAVAAIALRIRSIWPIIIAHWLLNVFLDTVLWLRM